MTGKLSRGRGLYEWTPTRQHLGGNNCHTPSGLRIASAASATSPASLLRRRGGGWAGPRRTRRWSETAQDSRDLLGDVLDRLHAIQGSDPALGPVEAQHRGSALVIDLQPLFQGFRVVVGPD